MREPGTSHIKAWAREYEESPFYFEQNETADHRLIAWAEDPELTKTAFYKVLDGFPPTVEVLVKIQFHDDAHAEGSKRLWSRYVGTMDQWQVLKVIHANEEYVFGDGSHQFCLRGVDSQRYLAFDEHGIFFIYEPTAEDAEIFKSLGFQARYAEPIFSKPHFKHLPPNHERLEMKFITELRLSKANSDLD